MINHILVHLDSSDRSFEKINYALSFASFLPSFRMTVFYQYPKSDSLLNENDWYLSEKTANTILQKAQQILHDAGIAFRIVVQEDGFTQVCSELYEKEPYGLLVTHARHQLYQEWEPIRIPCLFV